MAGKKCLLVLNDGKKVTGSLSDYYQPEILRRQMAKFPGCYFGIVRVKFGTE